MNSHMTEEVKAARVHELKSDPEVFDDVAAGLKTSEIRRNDRDYRIGDTLVLRRTKYTGAQMHMRPKDCPLEYTGEVERRVVSHVQSGYGLNDHWVCLSFAASRPSGGAGGDERGALPAVIEASRGVIGVAAELLRESLGPLGVSAAVIESEDGGASMDDLIDKITAFLAKYDEARAALSGVGPSGDGWDDFRKNVVAWAVSRWNDEVKNRPLVNVHRRTLDDTWRQVIREHGGDAVALLGPAHDDLVAAQKGQA